MGSSSESCALSGLEIRDGDEAILVLLYPKPLEIDGFKLTAPPMRGIYSGYGSLVLAEDARGLNGKMHRAGDDLTPPNGSACAPAWLHARIYDGLAELPHPERPATLGEWFDNHAGKIRAAVDVEPDGPLVDVPLGKEPDENLRMTRSDFRTAIDLQRTVMHDGIGYLMSYDLFHARRSGVSAFASMLEDYRKGWILKAAEIALRKRIVPGIVGPQDGGLETSRAFAALHLRVADSMMEQVPGPVGL